MLCQSGRMDNVSPDKTDKLSPADRIRFGIKGVSARKSRHKGQQRDYRAGNAADSPTTV